MMQWVAGVRTNALITPLDYLHCHMLYLSLASLNQRPILEHLTRTLAPQDRDHNFTVPLSASPAASSPLCSRLNVITGDAEPALIKFIGQIKGL